jgi:hypothetical protein
MANIKPVAGRVQIEVDRLDGGLNSQYSPNSLDLSESPDCLNVVFNSEGSVESRTGAYFVNTTSIGAAPLDGLASYNGSMIAWAGGSMYHKSGTTFFTVHSAGSQFTSGAVIAHVVYQNMLICSDGTNGPYRYHEPGSFYQLGVATPSAATRVTNGVGGVPIGTWYWKVSYVNTGVVEGEVGSATCALVLGAANSVTVSSLPIGAASLGVAQRFIYRGSTTAGPFRFVGAVSDNTTNSFVDNVGATTWAVGAEPPDDASKPTPFTTVYQHKERLFFDDSNNRSLLRYTDYTNPYVSQAENFVYLSKQDGNVILAVNVQQDLVTAFKDDAYYLIALNDPGDDTTWQVERGPGNIGIVGSRALCQCSDGLLFMGKQGGKITGVHLLSGTEILETSARVMKTRSISDRVKGDLQALPSGYFHKMAMINFQEQILIAHTDTGDTTNKYILWFDSGRIQSSDGQPGSWAPWDGRGAQMNCFVEFAGKLYGGSSNSDGFVYELLQKSNYSDVTVAAGVASAEAINAYWWSKPIGAGSTTGTEESIDSWIKDWRYLNLWYDLLGAFDMKVNYKTDGDASDGYSFLVDLNPGGSLWGVIFWGINGWGGGTTDKEKQFSFPIGPLVGRRVSIRLSNANTAGSAFRVRNMKLACNLRRQR